MIQVQKVGKIVRSEKQTNQIKQPNRYTMTSVQSIDRNMAQVEHKLKRKPNRIDRID